MEKGPLRVLFLFLLPGSAISRKPAKKIRSKQCAEFGTDTGAMP